MHFDLHGTVAAIIRFARFAFKFIQFSLMFCVGAGRRRKFNIGVRTQQMHLMHVGSQKRLADYDLLRATGGQGGGVRSRNADKRLVGIVALAHLRRREGTREDFATDRQGAHCKREIVGTCAK
jgi:hypothetical protein